MYSDPTVRLAFTVGFALTIVSVVLLTFALLSRVAFGIYDRRAAEVRRKSLDVLLACVEGQCKFRIRPVDSVDAFTVLTLWLSLVEALEGPARQRLINLLKGWSLRKVVPVFLNSYDIRKKMLGIAVAGHLKDQAQTKALVRTMESQSSASLLAFRSLAQIDPEHALQVAGTQIATREDWAAPALAGILNELGRDLAVRHLRGLLNSEKLSEAAMVRTINFLSTLQAQEEAGTILRLLNEAGSPNIKIACLSALRNLSVFAALDAIRDAILDPDPLVRAEAALTLGRLGTPSDADLLVVMLADEHKWVRYRAAQAIGSLPDLGMQELASIREALSDPEMKELIAQIASEEVTTAATLQSLFDKEATGGDRQVRQYLNHPNWRIRLQVMDYLALGGSAASQAQFSELTSNHNWWMRYEAAKDLFAHKAFGEKELERLLKADIDQRSKEIFRRASFEGYMA